MKYIGRRAYFFGKHDDAKGRMMLLLYQFPLMWFTPRRIHAITGVKLCSTRAQCRRMYVIRLKNTLQPPYLERRIVGHPWHGYFYEYRIQEDGINWVIGAIAAGMPIDKYIQEAEVWQQSQEKEGKQ